MHIRWEARAKRRVSIHAGDRGETCAYLFGPDQINLRALRKRRTRRGNCERREHDAAEDKDRKEGIERLCELGVHVA